MQWVIFKYAIAAGMVRWISELARCSDKLGRITATPPLVTALTFILLFMENHNISKNCQSCLVSLLVCRSDLANDLRWY